MRSAPFLLVGVFVVGMMAVTAALPPHMISLLRGNGLAEAWVIAIPASIGVIQVLGRLLLFFFEHHFDLHLANRLIPMLIPLGLAALLAGAGYPWAALLFVLLYGLGNGMLTIVKGTAIAQYVSRDHVASLNGALGLPSALARALAPLLLGVLWSAQAGYSRGLWLLLGVSVASVLALMLAQRRRHRALSRRAVRLQYEALQIGRQQRLNRATSAPRRARLVLQLVLADLADVEVGAVGMRQVEAADAGRRHHRQALGQCPCRSPALAAARTSSRLTLWSGQAG